MTDRWTVEEAEAGLRLDKFLAAAGRLASRGRATDALARGKVFVDDVEVGPADGARRLEPGTRVRLWMDRPGSSRRVAQRPPKAGELPIVYEDDVLVVVNKPAGLLTVPLPRRDEAPSVEEALADHLRSKGRRRPLVVHRIDRDTSGLVMFATRADAQARLKDQFRRHTAQRIYLALVYGVPRPARGTWRDHLVWDQEALVQKETHPSDPRASSASCDYDVLETFGERAALIQVSLVTGRRNQIRLQARLRGHTLIGEQRYVFGPQSLRTIEFPRQALHAWRLGVDHPVTGRPLRFEAPLPPDMAELIAELSS
ncbi:MAG: RluA family pseudouridine synthase [Acidobacteria bacterium]|nr:RluA family pseudouridine synthase [Acidobacteriota bacterium]